MRELIGFVLLEGLLALAGFGVLGALGLLPASRLRDAGWGSWLIGLGPALLTGTALAAVLLIALLVIGVPLTLATILLVAAAITAVGFGLARWRTARADADAPAHAPNAAPTKPWRIAIGVAALYVLAGAYALARALTRNDDARIWSLKGLTLTYHGTLRPEVFLNPATALAHPVYPLFQPVLEAMLGRAMGQPELRLVHAELWLLFVAALWTVGYLVWWRQGRPVREQIGIAMLVLLAVTPAVISNMSSGFADATGAVLLATGAVAVGLWIDRAHPGHLGLGAILLAAAANTKDEDTVGVVLVLLAAGVVCLVRRDRAGLRPWLAGIGLCLILVLPWRIWTAAHHLSDSVVPPLPRSLSPVFVLDRAPQLKQTALAMVNATLGQWGWLAAIFIALCLLGLITRTARGAAAFYLLIFAALVASLLWLYTTTPVSLSFLISTSMSRTVTVFMALTPLACAHLLTRLLSAGESDREQPQTAGDPTGLPAEAGSRSAPV